MTFARQKLSKEHVFPGVLAAFLNAGSLKADPRLAWMPGDLTFVFAITLAIIIGVSLYRDEHHTAGSQILWALCFLGLVLPGVMLAPVHSYAAEKSLYLTTLTLLAFLAGMEAGQRSNGLKRLSVWLVLFGLLITSDALVKVLTSGGTLQRVSGFGGTTITLGAAAGLVILVEGTQFLHWPKSIPRQIFGLVLVILATSALLFSGSKGPLISVLVSVLVTLLVSGRKEALARFLTLGGVTALGLAFSWSLMPAGSLDRLSLFFAGDFGDSETTRWLALEKALPLLGTHPLGIGWGGFMGQIPQWGQEARQYVHNLFLELFLEGGWVTGVGFMALAIRSWFSMRENTHQDERLLWIGLMLFISFNALVSGDVNDNRMFFVFLGYGLSHYAPQPWTESPSGPPERVPPLLFRIGQ